MLFAFKKLCVISLTIRYEKISNDICRLFIFVMSPSDTSCYSLSIYVSVNIVQYMTHNQLGETHQRQDVDGSHLLLYFKYVEYRAIKETYLGHDPHDMG